MKLFVFFLLSISQLLLPASLHTDVTLSSSLVSYELSGHNFVAKSAPQVTISRFETHKDFLADSEIGIEEAEAFLQPLNCLANPHRITEPPQFQIALHQVELPNFLLIYISRFSTSPPVLS